MEKKIKRLDLINQAKKKTYDEHGEILKKKQKIEVEMKQKADIIQIEEKKMDDGKEINEKLSQMYVIYFKFIDRFLVYKKGLKKEK